MTTAIPTSVIPPATGLDKEEPEFAEEDDIPSDDDHSIDATSSSGRESSRDAERE